MYQLLLIVSVRGLAVHFDVGCIPEFIQGITELMLPFFHLCHVLLCTTISCNWDVKQDIGCTKCGVCATDMHVCSIQCLA